MKCVRCQQESPSGAKFCAQCGTPLARDCARCRTALPSGAKFCPQCAQPVDATIPPETRFVSPRDYTPPHIAEKILSSKGGLEGERKHVTVLFADLKGSMELLADRDPEDSRRLLDAVLDVRQATEREWERRHLKALQDGMGTGWALNGMTATLEALARGEDAAAVLDSLSQGLTNKLLHAPTQALKKTK